MKEQGSLVVLAVERQTLFSSKLGVSCGVRGKQDGDLLLCYQ